jgi:F420-dependent oxidoreductase-like protein
VWRREKVQHQSRHYTIPLPADQGTGLGKPLKIINHPVRDRIPIVLAAIGPKNVALTAEIAEGWLPILFVPERAHEVWGESLEAGKAERDPSLGDLQTYLQASLCITEDADTAQAMLDGMRPFVALYVGGMGAKGKNFYNELAQRYGYEEEAEKIQDLYLDGKKDEAAAAVPEELVKAMSLIGPRTYVAERLQAFADAGVTTINVTPLAGTAAERVSLVGAVKELAADL